MKKAFLPSVLVLLILLASCYDTSSEISSQSQSESSLSVNTSSENLFGENVSSSISENEIETSSKTDGLVAQGQTNALSSQSPNKKPKPSFKDLKASNKIKIQRIIDRKTTKDMSNLEKANAIYKWLFTNFGYRAAFVDTENGISTKQTHELAAHYFRYYRGSCEHYAAVSKLIFEELGFECKYVFGSRYSNLSYKWGEHVWLVMKVDGNWYHVDGLFAGFFAEDMNDYFCVPDKKLKGTHKWDKDSVPKCSKSQIKL